MAATTYLEMGSSEDGGDGERDARRAEATLRAIGEASTEGIVLHERGVIVSVNGAAAAMFGYPAAELPGRAVVEFIAPDQADAVRSNYENDRAATYETWGLRRDGTRFRLEARARNIASGEGTVRAVLLRDLTDRDAAASQQASTNSLLRATLDATADGMLVVDLRGRITLWNARFKEMWRFPDEVLLEKADEQAIAYAEGQLLDPGSFRSRIQALYRAPETESIDTLEFRDGRIVERYSRPQRIGDRIIGRVWSFRDVTSHRRAERMLELAVQMRDEFLGIASHELFTPITSLSIAIRGLRAAVGTGLSPSAQGLSDRLCGNAERQVERLARLVQELLDVTKIDGGLMALSVEPFDLRDLATEVIERFMPELERDGISARLEAPRPVPGCWDRSRLEQVLTNLLANAIKFGNGLPIELSVQLEAGAAELAVVDHGIGIPADQQVLIFERFQRAVSSRHFAGLGLGLYITRQIVEAHGGELRLVSQPGAGSTFTVRLPLAVPTAPVRA